MSEQDAASAANPLPGGFLRNVNFVFLATLAGNILNFFIAILLARALGPEGRGITALYQGSVALAYALLSLGVAPATIYFVARRELSPRQAMEAGLSVAAIAGGATLVGVAVIGVLIGDELAEKHLPYWLAVVAIPVVIQARVAETVLRALARFGAMNVLEFSIPLCILVSLAAADVSAGLTVSHAVWAWSLGLMPPVVLGYALLGRDLWPRRLGGLALLVKTVRFGSQSQLGNLIQLLNYRLDSYLILFFVNASGVGLYAVAVAGSEGLFLIANSVAVVLLTNITAGDAANAARLTPVVCRNTILVTAAVCLGASVVAPIIIPAVFGAAFQDAVPAYLWLLPGTVALAGAKILAAYVFSRGRPMINTWISLAALAVGLGADLVLIPWFEVSGAAAGASIGYGASLLLTAIAYRRLSGGSIMEALLPRPADAALYIDGLRSILARLRASRSSARERLGSSS